MAYLVYLLLCTCIYSVLLCLRMLGMHMYTLSVSYTCYTSYTLTVVLTMQALRHSPPGRYHPLPGGHIRCKISDIAYDNMYSVVCIM